MITNTTHESNISKVVKTVLKWLQQINFMPKLSKTKLVNFFSYKSKNNSKLNLIINYETIEAIENVTFLKYYVRWIL